MVKKHDKLLVQNREPLLLKLSGLIQNAHKVVNRYIDNTMTLTYFFVGRYIIEDEQQGQERAAYADETLKFLGDELTHRFGRGFSARNLASMKKFYLTYQTRMNAESILQIDSAKSDEVINNEVDNAILQNGSAKFVHPFPLSWSHYLILCRIDDTPLAPERTISSLNTFLSPALFVRCRTPRFKTRGYQYFTPTGLSRLCIHFSLTFH